MATVSVMAVNTSATMKKASPVAALAPFALGAEEAVLDRKPGAKKIAEGKTRGADKVTAVVAAAHEGVELPGRRAGVTTEDWMIDSVDNQ